LVCSSECLYFVLNFVPLLKKWIEKENGEAVKELTLFDGSLKECKDLLNKTYEKIVIITKDVMEDASKKLVDAKWEGTDDAVKEDIAGLLKNQKTIQNVMKSYLSTHPELLKTIYGKIFGLFIERFKTVVAFMKTKITASKAKKNFAEYLRVFCDRLNESGDLMSGAGVKSLEETLISEGFKN
jgi:ABC-type Na+ transport system ATPase subunit NatA